MVIAEEIIKSLSAQILVLDGLTAEEKILFSVVHDWRSKASNRKVVVVSSSQVALSHEVAQYFFKVFFPSWLFVEYDAAMKQDEFYNSVVLFLSSAVKKKDKISEKYFYAGVSARWMFSRTLEEVIELARDCIMRVENVNDLFQGYVQQISSICKPPYLPIRYL
jgi:hypothetical protein